MPLDKDKLDYINDLLRDKKRLVQCHRANWFGMSAQTLETLQDNGNSHIIKHILNARKSYLSSEIRQKYYLFKYSSKQSCQQELSLINSILETLETGVKSNLKMSESPIFYVHWLENEKAYLSCTSMFEIKHAFKCFVVQMEASGILTYSKDKFMHFKTHNPDGSGHKLHHFRFPDQASLTAFIGDLIDKELIKEIIAQSVESTFDNTSPRSAVSSK